MHNKGIHHMHSHTCKQKTHAHIQEYTNTNAQDTKLVAISQVLFKHTHTYTHKRVHTFTHIQHTKTKQADHSYKKFFWSYALCRYNRFIRAITFYKSTLKCWDIIITSQIISMHDLSHARSAVIPSLLGNVFLIEKIKKTRHSIFVVLTVHITEALNTWFNF